MINFVRNFWKEEEGQDIVEYALLLAFVVVASAALFTGTATKIKTVWNTVDNTLNSAATP